MSRIETPDETAERICPRHDFLRDELSNVLVEVHDAALAAICARDEQIRSALLEEADEHDAERGSAPDTAVAAAFRAFAARLGGGT